MEKIKNKRKAYFVDLGIIEYNRAWEIQNRYVDARYKGLIENDIFLVMEHNNVFTLGKRGGLDNLTVSEGFLKKKRIPVVNIERGGNITYHGPGQLVVYPVINLEKIRLDVTGYVNKLETIMIESSKKFSVSSSRDERNPGVWVGNNKMGSIGIAIRKGVTFHGFAINVNLSLEPFSWINPCGLSGIRMTSVEKEANKKVDMVDFKNEIVSQIEKEFRIEFTKTDIDELEKIINS